MEIANREIIRAAVSQDLRIAVVPKVGYLPGPGSPGVGISDTEVHLHARACPTQRQNMR